MLSSLLIKISEDSLKIFALCSPRHAGLNPTSPIVSRVVLYVLLMDGRVRCYH